MWDLDGDGGLSDAHIRGVLGDLRRERERKGRGEGVRRREIRTRGQRGRSKGNEKFVWELPEKGGLNRDIEITVRIPGYLVAGLRKEAKRGKIDWVVREAVKEYLVKRGQTWWQPRFMSVLKAQEIEARNRFTRTKGLE